MNLRRQPTIRIAALFIAFFASKWLPSYSGQDIHWARIREAYKTYTSSPSPQNAERLMEVLPSTFDNKSADPKEWSTTLEFLDNEPFRALEVLIRHGDESAIRIAFRTHVITDGAISEDLLEIISEAIRANILVFLEELKALKKDHEHSVRFLLRRDGDIDTYTLFDDPQARVEFNREIMLRVKSLRTVTRPDLMEIRDYCLRYYEEMLKEGK